MIGLKQSSPSPPGSGDCGRCLARFSLRRFRQVRHKLPPQFINRRPPKPSSINHRKA
jgi:hypothetical protein